MFALKCGRVAGRTLQCYLMATFSHNFKVLMGTATPSSALSERERKSMCVWRSHHQAQMWRHSRRAFQALCKSSYWAHKLKRDLWNGANHAHSVTEKTAFSWPQGSIECGGWLCTLALSLQNQSSVSHFYFCTDYLQFHCKISFCSRLSSSAQKAKPLQVQEARRDLPK